MSIIRRETHPSRSDLPDKADDPFGKRHYRLLVSSHPSDGSSYSVSSRGLLTRPHRVVGLALVVGRVIAIKQGRKRGRPGISRIEGDLTGAPTVKAIKGQISTE